MDNDKLLSIQNQPLNYKALCDNLGLEYKYGNSKSYQLEQLQAYCNLEKLSNPTRYLITEVYDEPILALLDLNANNKFQLLFDSVMYQVFISNHGAPVYLSNIEMLRLFQEVNDNFAYACHTEHMKALGEEYIYMAQMSQTVYRILIQWTKRRIEKMEARNIVTTSQGYRLYEPNYSSKGFYKTKLNVPQKTNTLPSPLEDWCKEIYKDVGDRVVSPDWKNEWLSEGVWVNFKKELAKAVSEQSNGKYCDLRKVLIVSPPSEHWVQAKLDEMFRNTPALKEINQEACKKILATTQLNINSANEKAKFIEVNMKPNPPFLIKDRLKEHKEKP